MRHGNLLSILASLAFLAGGPLMVQTARADANNPDVIPTFVDALNRGDTTTAQQLAAPNLTLTLGSGQSFAISASIPIPAELLPITIVSLSPEEQGSQTVDGVLTFGSNPSQQRVQFKGDAGVIVSIRVLGP
ncbi:MAG TPA: hypothetical protein VK821_08685 [Dehalococcoidia bacterium]|nr:hypothetical protein [Dehalococcoidia bacterium]